VGIKGNINSSPWYITLDDISIGLVPTCQEPTAITASAITTNTATISWTAPATAPGTGYDVYYSTTNTAPTTTTTPNWSGNAVTTNLASLSANTQYFVWVRSVCSASDKSTWVALPSFTTLCNAYTIPYFEGFETGYTNATAVAGCLSQASVAGSSNWTANNTATDYNRSPRTGAWNAYLQYGNERWLFIPVQLTGGTAYQVKLYARQDGATATDASMMISYGTAATDAAMTNSIVADTPIVNGSYQPISGNFIPATTGTYIIGIKGKMNSTPWYISLDDISINLAPTCLEPTAFTASAITASSATLSWTAPATAPANGYDVYYSTTNTAPTATTTPTWSGNAISTNLSSLSANTQYFAWVRSVCSASDKSTWVSLPSFTTMCSSTTVPYTENFESVTPPALPNCGSSQNAGTGNNWATVSNPGSGFTTKALQYLYNFSNAANAWYYTQGITMTTGTNYTIAFDYGNNSTTYKENLKVMFGTAADYNVMINPIVDLSSINDGVLHSVSYTFTVPANGVYYFGFNCYSGANQYNLYVDNISITNATAGTSEIASTKDAIKVYPNPFTEVLNISDVRNVKSVSIVDASGRLVKTIDKPTAQLQLGDLTSGLYMVTLHYNNGTTQTVKAMKK
jgi:hypothetical protein